MSDAPVSLPLRGARMSVLGRALRRADLSFPLTLEFPGDVEHGRAEATFGDRASIERTLTDAQVNAMNDGAAVYTLPDGGFVLAQKISVNPWDDHVAATAPRRRWLGDIGRNWLGRR